MSSYATDTIYELLLKRFKEKGFLNPESALNACIREVMQKGGRTRDEAIRELHSSDSPWIYSPVEPSSDIQQQKATAEDIAVAEQIAKLKEKIDSLTTLFTDGKINEETYTRGVKGIEDDIGKLQREHKIPFSEVHTRSPSRTSGSERYTTMEETEYPYYGTSVSRSWYLVPFFFGILGGIVAYVAVKDEDAEMADNLLIFGILWTFALAFIGWILLLH